MAFDFVKFCFCSLARNDFVNLGLRMCFRNVSSATNKKFEIPFLSCYLIICGNLIGILYRRFVGQYTISNILYVSFLYICGKSLSALVLAIYFR